MKLPYLTALLVSLGSIASVNATTLAYEGFSFTDNNTGTDTNQNIDAQGSGTGFLGNWTAGTDNERTVNGYLSSSNRFAFPTNVPYTTSNTGGNSHWAGTVGGGYGEGVSFRSLASAINFDSAGTYYLSYLAITGGNDSSTFVGFASTTTGAAASTDPNIVFGLGNYFRSSGGPDAAPEVAIGLNKTVNSGTTLDNNLTAIQGDPYFLVAKIVTSGTEDDQFFLSAYAAGDTVDAADPASWDLTATADLTGFYDSLYMGSGGFSNPAIDEIRLGTEWADVTGVPEPSSTALLGLGGLALILRRRK